MPVSDTPLRLRPETPQDREFLALLYRTTRNDLQMLPAAMLDGLLAMQFQMQQAAYRQQFPDADFSLIEVGEEPCGCITVHRNTERFRLVNIALLPEMRNRGLGRGLIHALQQEATAAGKPLTLSVSTQNAGAQRLYTALGFVVTSDDGAYREMVWLPQRSV